ncbi:MAG: hypothetical protein L3J83_08280, partial [Proteobacteria bacterium]|nr:hypothetical protein [Pseudomonadota bacterium]
MKTQNKQKLNRFKQPILALIFMLSAIPVHAVIITKNFTGLWLLPDYNSQGFDIQIIDQNGVPQAVVTWYTYDTDGNPMWVTGLGDIQENTASMDLLAVTIQNNDPATRNVVTLATAYFKFDNCDKGTVEIAPVSINSISGTGGLIDIERLTAMQATEWSGGISDHTSPQ